MNAVNEIDLDSRPIRNPAYALQEGSCGWAALVNLDTPAGVAVNATGLLIWRRIDGIRTVREIIREIKGFFADAPPALGDDVLAILDVLLEAGLIGYEVNI